jgi:hypothetical protein
MNKSLMLLGKRIIFTMVVVFGFASYIFAQEIKGAAKIRAKGEIDIQDVRAKEEKDPITGRQFKAGCELAELNCGHSFLWSGRGVKNGIQDWLKTNDTCPSCGEKVSTIDIYKIVSKKPQLGLTPGTF